MFRVRWATQAGCPRQVIQGFRETNTTPATRLRHQVSWQSVCLGTVRDRVASLRFKNYSSFHEGNTHTNTHTASRLEESGRQTLIIKGKLKYNKAPKEIVSGQREERLQTKKIVFEEILKGRQNFNLEHYEMACVLRRTSANKDQKVESERRVQISSGVCRSPLFLPRLGKPLRSLPATRPCCLCGCVPDLELSVSLLVILTFWRQKGH